MRKIIFAIAFLYIGGAAVHAQTPANTRVQSDPAMAQPAKVESSAQPLKLDAAGQQIKAESIQAETKSAGKKTSADGTKLKKDGTPDMRYKKNKEAAAKDKAAAPAKK